MATAAIQQQSLQSLLAPCLIAQSQSPAVNRRNQSTAGQPVKAAQDIIAVSISFLFPQISGNQIDRDEDHDAMTPYPVRGWREKPCHPRFHSGVGGKSPAIPDSIVPNDKQAICCRPLSSRLNNHAVQAPQPGLMQQPPAPLLPHLHHCCPQLIPI